MSEANFDAISSMQDIAKATGIEVATKPDKSKSIELASTREWLSHLEASRPLENPTNNVARVDAALAYIKELQVRNQEAKRQGTTVSLTDVEAGTNKYKSIANERVKQTENIADELTAIPDGSNPDQLAGAIIKARVLSEAQKLMQIPNEKGVKPTFEEALQQIESGIAGSRQVIIENGINDAIRTIRSPEKFYQGDANTYEAFAQETEALRNQAQANLGALEIFQYANYYTQAGNRVERTAAITQAIENAANPNTKHVFGREERLQILLDYSESNGLLNKGQRREILAKYPHIKVSDRPASTEPTKVADNTSMIVKTEDGRLPENTPGICTPEDVEHYEKKVIDKEHVHYHARAVFVPDTHGANQTSVEESIKRAYGTEVQIEFRDGKVYADGAEVTIYQGGDIIDNNKDLVRWYSMDAGGLGSQAEYEAALADNAHPKHERAVRRKDYFDKTPGAYEEYQRNWDRLKNMKIDESADYWKEAVKDGRVLWGNHEAMMMAGFIGDNKSLLMWLGDTNQGSSTLQALTGLSRERNLGLVSLDETIIDNMDPQKKIEICNKVREALRNSPKSKELITNLLDNAKLYNIVNDQLLIHACIPIDQNTGRLIPPESSGTMKAIYTQEPTRTQYPSDEAYQSAVSNSNKAKEFYEKVEKLTGLDALDYLEVEIRAKNPYAILFVQFGGPEKMSPLWGRKPFQEAMQLHGDVAMAELSKQAEKKGATGGIKKIIVGHTPAIGGSQIGEHLLGADDDHHNAVRLELTKDATGKVNTEVKAQHNFGSSKLITNTI